MRILDEIESIIPQINKIREWLIQDLFWEKCLNL